MSDDLDFDMEVVEDKELDELSADGASNSRRESYSSTKMSGMVKTDGRGDDAPDSKDGEEKSTAVHESSSDSKRKNVFDDLPEEWDAQKLKDHVDLISGAHVKSDKVHSDPNGTPYLTGPEDFDGLGFEVTKYTDAPTKFCEESDTLVTVKGSGCGKSALADSRACISRQLKSLRPSESLNPFFLYYYVKSKQDWLLSLSEGSAIPGLSNSHLTALDLARPPLHEQRKLASVLYAVDQAIQKTEAIIEQAKRVKQGLMQDLFENGYYDHSISERRIGPRLRNVPESWDVVGIGELADYQNGYGFSKDEWSDQGRPIVRIQDLTRPEESDVNYFDGPVDEKYEIENGDILVSWSATLGVFRWNRGSAVLNQHIFKVRNIKEFVGGGYLYYALNYALSELERKLHGSTMKHVTRSAFENTEVPLPGLDEQKKISRVLGSVDEEIRTEEAKKQNLEQVKKGLMQDLLTGEVRTADKAIEVLDEVAAHR
jgi:type I restriction enzyme S subunit